ncbi:hypothetical protein FOZ63_009100, partial [Perkinsus olseni]
MEYQVYQINRLIQESGIKGERLTVEQYSNPQSPWQLLTYSDTVDIEEGCNQDAEVFVVAPGEGTTSEQQETTATGTPHKMEMYQRGQRLEEKDEDLDEDVLAKDDRPPWGVIERRWVSDDTAVLGRPLVKVPWVSKERPPFNFRTAARRGMSSLKRLTPGQYEQFERALKVYVDKGFCDMVKDNSEDGYSQPPTATECQRVWEKLTDKGALRGTIVTMPRHFTPSHMVFREEHVTTPCRIVLDYREMNRYCFKGGKSQNDLSGILLPYFGGVEESDDGERLVVPIVYGEEEVCSLKNVKHAVALQEVIYAHLAKGRRVYVDADDTTKTLELKDGYEKDRDGQNVREARTRTAVEQGLAAWRRQVERGRVEDPDNDDIVDDHEDDAEPAREGNVDVDDGEEGDNVDDHEDNAI